MFQNGGDGCTTLLQSCQMVHSKWVNYMECEIYLNKAVKKKMNKTQDRCEDVQFSPYICCLKYLVQNINKYTKTPFHQLSKKYII